ncbi:MAG: phosphate ABC transporter permease PstA [Gammaproteobacteria bacterium]
MGRDALIFHPHYTATRRDALARAALTVAVAIVAGTFVWILAALDQSGGSRISWQFLVTPPQDAGRAGGIASILVATGLILAVALTVAVPLALGTAVLLVEFMPARSALGRYIRHSLNVLAAVPSIVFGLFGSAFFSIYLGLGFSILSGGLTLACMVLPILISTTEAGLRAVPESTRQAAAALGLSRATTVRTLLLPAATPALVAGLLLGIGRAMAETAALIFTSAYVDRMPSSLMDSGRALSVHIYDLSMNVPGGDGNAYAAALILVLLLLIVNTVAWRLARRWRQGTMA